MISTPLATLLADLVDYAGLFPPAELGMSEAVDEFARQRLGAEGWILGRFVVPIARLDELERVAADYLPRDPGIDGWQLSVLAGEAVDDDRRRIDEFHRAHTASPDAGRIRIAAVEAKTVDAAAVDRAAEAFRGLELYCELPWGGEHEPLLAAIAEAGRDGDVAAKIRTGGVDPAAIPEVRRVARFLLRAAAAGVAWKATAGLHHAVRGEHPLTYAPGSPRATMHGFLNLFLAAALARQGQVDESDLVRLLEEGSAAGLESDEHGVRWQGHRLDDAALAAGRRFARSFGSCSFREPLAELQALGLLPAASPSIPPGER